MLKIFFFFLWIHFVISTNYSCLVLHSSNSFGSSRSGSCFEVSVADLNQLIIYTQSNIVGFLFTLNDGTNRTFLENSIYSNNYTIGLSNKAIIGVNVYIGQGVEGLQFQFDDSTSTQIFGRSSGCLYYLNSTFMKIQYFLINSIHGCIDNVNSSYFPYIAFSYSFSKCPSILSSTTTNSIISTSTTTTKTTASLSATLTTSPTTTISAESLTNCSIYCKNFLLLTQKLNLFSQEKI